MVDDSTTTTQIAVLGSILLSPELYPEVMSKVRPDEFSNDRCRLIYQAMQGLFLDGVPIDPVVLAARLQGFDKIRDDIVQIMDVTPTAANVWHYVDALKEQAQLARLQELGQQLNDAGSLAAAQALIDKVNDSRSSRPGLARLSARDMLQSFMDRHANGKRPDYLTWPLSKLNDYVFLERGDFVLIGGYPSAGKTALSLQFAWHHAKKYRVGYYSIETDPAKLSDRSMSALAKISMQSIKRGGLTQTDWDSFGLTSGEIAQHNLDIIPAAGMTVNDIRYDALAHRYDIIYIDYLQLIQPPTQRTINRVEIVTGISIGLHQMAQTHGITVIALSQLHRPESGKGAKATAPDMHHIRESGQLEQDADAIMLLYLENPEDTGSRRTMKVAKNKEGTIGKFNLDFDGDHQTFTQANTPKGEQYRQTMKAIRAAGKDAGKPEPTYHQSQLTEVTGDDPDLPF